MSAALRETIRRELVAGGVQIESLLSGASRLWGARGTMVLIVDIANLARRDIERLITGRTK